MAHQLTNHNTTGSNHERIPTLPSGLHRPASAGCLRERTQCRAPALRRAGPCRGRPPGAVVSTPWAHLPNAERIDQILAHLKQHPDRWVAAHGAARYAARDAAWDAARYAARDAAWVAAWYAAWHAARAAAMDAAWSAIAALIAWDDCAPILDMPADAVRLLAAVGHHPAVLLLPAVLTMNGETQ